MTEEHKNPPKTVQEIGIHLGYMNETLKDIKDIIKDTPTRKEFDDLKKEVDNNSLHAVTKREFKIGLTTVTTLLTIAGGVALLIDKIKGA